MNRKCTVTSIHSYGNNLKPANKSMHYALFSFLRKNFQGRGKRNPMICTVELQKNHLKVKRFKV